MSDILSDLNPNKYKLKSEPNNQASTSQKNNATSVPKGDLLSDLNSGKYKIKTESAVETAFTAEDAARRLAVKQDKDARKQEMQNAYIAKEMDKVLKGAELVKDAQNIMNMQQERVLKGAENLSDYAKTLPTEKIEELKATSPILNPEKYHKDVDAGYYGRKAAEGFSRAGEGIVDAATIVNEHMQYPKLKAAEFVTSLGGLAKNPVSNAFTNRLVENKEAALKAVEETPTDNYSKITDFTYNNVGKGHKLLGDVVSGVTAMAPTIAMNLLIPGSGYGALGMQAFGSGTQQAYQNTGELGAKEEIYGLLSGLAEVGIEKLSGGIGGLGNGAIDDIAKKIIKNGLIRNATGEGIEEAITTFIDPYLQRLTYNKGAEGAKLSEVLRSALIGSLTSMVLQGGSAAINTTSNVVNTSLNTDKSVKKLSWMDKETQNQLKGLENLLPQKNNTTGQATNDLQQPVQQGNRTEGQTAQNGNMKQTVKNVENSDILEYNNYRGEENGELQFGRILERDNESSRIYEENKSEQTQRYTRAEYEQFEKSIRPIGEERITNTERELIQHYKDKYNKDVVLFDEKENQGYIGGASFVDKNKIYVDINSASEFGYNMIVSHEVMESDILHNQESKKDIIDNIAEKIMSDPNFEQQKIEFWRGQDGDMPSDYLIAKDIICDRFAELDNNESLSYKNVLSQETNMTLDYGISNFRETINKSTQADEQSAFSMPKNEVQSFASSEAGKPYMDLDRYTSRDNKSQVNKVGLTDIQNAINDIVTVKAGKFRQQAYGIYKTQGEIIRLKQMKDIPVALHELTHHLDKKYNLSSSDKAFKELENIAVVGKNATKQTVIKEGVAEFGRYYMTDKEYAKEIAPFYYDAFERALDSDLAMKGKVENIRQMVSDYLEQSPLNRLSSNIDYGDEEISLWKKSKDSIVKSAKSFRKNFVDDLDPLKKIVNEIAGDKKLMTEEDAYKLLRLNNGVTGKIEVALEYGVVNKNGKKIGKSMKEILEPVATQQKEFVAYLTALRAKDLQDRGIESGMLSRDVDDVIKTYKSNEPFNNAAKELYDFQNQILETTLVDSGIITKDALKAYNKNNPHYIPFYRVMDENFKQSKESKSKKPTRIKGSTRDIINPLESIIKNTYSYMQMAERNDTFKVLFDMANKYDGTGKWFDKVPTDMIGTKVTSEDVKSILEQLNLGEEDVNYNEVFTTLFKPASNQKGNIVTVMQKGKPVHYEINDKELYDILSPTIKGENFIVKLLSPASKALRVGATHTPEFVLRNPLRDTADAGIYSKNKFRPVVDTLIGMFNVAGRTDLYYKWLQSGGSGSTYTNAQRPVLQKTLKGLTEGVTSEKGAKKVLKGAENLIKHPLRTYLDVAGSISNITEEGTRVGEFRRALQKGKTEKEAALDSREITLDFSRGGKYAKDINKVVAFFNAELQGLDKMLTSFKDRPVATFIKSLAYVTLPAMILRGLQDEDELEKVPQWEKDEFFVFFVNGMPIKLPKSQGVGQIFGTIPERAIDYLKTKDKDAFDGFMQRLVTSYVPVDSTTSIFPNFFLPLIENTANYSFFKQQPIVNQSLQNRSPKYQYDENTSTLAKTVGRVLNYSPKKIDNIISGYAGNLGKDAANLIGMPIDLLSGEKKENEYKSLNSKLKKVPLLKGFIASDYASKSLDKFYKSKEEVSTKYTDAKFKTSDGKTTASELAELKYYKELNSMYNKAYSEIKEIDEEIDKVTNGAGSDKYKETIIEQLRQEKDAVAEGVEKQLKGFDVKFNK